MKQVGGLRQVPATASQQILGGGGKRKDLAMSPSSCAPRHERETAKQIFLENSFFTPSSLTFFSPCHPSLTTQRWRHLITSLSISLSFFPPPCLALGMCRVKARARKLQGSKHFLPGSTGSSLKSRLGDPNKNVKNCTKF